jgi:hypothetical protein
MTLQQWITLIIAILGVLHGPLVTGAVKSVRNRKRKP